MLAAIVKRELIDHLISLRFGLALVLIVGLMVLNALGFVGGSYEFRRDHYLEQVQAEQEIGRSNAQMGLWKLIVHGGQDYIYKKPSPLMFCAVGANDALPERLWTPSWQFEYNGIQFYDPFPLIYWDIVGIWAPKASQLMQTRAIDWVFIIGGLLSLMALLFTFDAFIGEKERGTLMLVMAQSLPRHTLLLGKFLGAMLALAIVLSLAIIVNLLIVIALSQMNLGLVEAGRLIGMVGLALLYLACFVGLGLWVSIRSSTTRSSLVGVLLLWTCGVLLWPSAGGALASRVLVREFGEAVVMEWEFNPPEKMKIAEYRGRARRRDMRKPEKLRQFADADHANRRAIQDREDQFLAYSLGEVEKARHIVRLSPMGCFQYGMEALVGTGLARHRSFVEQARTYVQQFEQTMLNLDRDDPKSLHIPIAQGLSNQKIDPDILPVFTENLSATTLLRHAVVDVIGLFFFATLTYMLAYQSWLRASIV